MVRRANNFRSYDPFSKPIDGVRNQTMVGGIITILASFTAISLFMSQICIYFQVDTRHSFILSQSHPLSLVVPTEGGYSNLINSPYPPNGQQARKSQKQQQKNNQHDVDFLESNRMTISVHLTFPHVYCQDLDYSHDGSSRTNGKLHRFYGPKTFTTRAPTDYEHYRATTGCTESEAAGKNRKVGIPSSNPDVKKGCTIEGSLTVPRIGGDLTFTMTDRAWNLLAKRMSGMLPAMRGPSGATPASGWEGMAGMYNMTYFVHDVTFYDGRSTAGWPSAGPETIGSTNPLKGAVGTPEGPVGVAHTSLTVTLIPTRVKRFARKSENIYQASVSKTVIGAVNMVMSQTQIAPGLSIQYDFSPLAVHHVESRENVFVFLSSLVGIVGGVFVTVGLVSGCLVSSAAAVSKKID